ncbi:MAG: PPOX class F420-dependent oxidoreductase [Pseudomonadota bacterium]
MTNTGETQQTASASALWQSFRAAPYVSLATFRKSGVSVPTAIWAAPDQDHLYAFSAGQAGKVKRLRNSARAQLAVCDVRGKVLGPWLDVRAFVITEPTEKAVALQAMRKKYGWQMRLTDFSSRLTGRFRQRAYLRIEPVPEAEPETESTEHAPT